MKFRETHALPADMRLHRMTGIRRGRDYQLVMSKLDSDYEQWISHVGGPDGNTRLLTKLLGRKGTLVDVGANIGTVAVPAAVEGSSVIAVEMNPQNCLRLWLVARVNKLRQFHIVQAAASDHAGMVTFQGTAAWGHVTASGDGQPAVCLQLDEILARFGRLARPVVFKIDVEGHEVAVLRGAREALQHWRPPVLFEAIELEGESNDSARRTKELLEAAGYRLFLLRGEVLCPRTASDLQEGHVADFLAVPAERLATVTRKVGGVRDLTDAERIDWVREMATFPMENHQRHAARVLLRWSHEEPDVAKQAAGELVPHLVDLEHLADLRDELSHLL